MVNAEVELSLMGHWKSLPQSEMRTTGGFVQKELCFSTINRHVQLLTTPRTVVCQAPLSMGLPMARILEWVAIY